MEERTLRNGYTTGSCAAAAAKAAALYLLTGNNPEYVVITLPNRETARFRVEKVSGDESCFRVRKDSGDDPDVTDKTYIHATCHLVPAGSFTDPEGRGYTGTGYIMEGKPAVYIDGGRGIGIVTLEGLSCPVGHYAINPVPREEIVRAVREACEESGRYDDLLISLSVPEGETIAKKTFNPRLGITGGISILGTSGIVRAMSDDAILQTIRLELHMRAVAGKKTVILTPGNYGENFLKQKLGIPEGTAVQISNFVRDSVLMACEENFTRILLAGHMGKLIKVAAGLPNTHSRYGDKRMETFTKLLDRTIDRLNSFSGNIYSEVKSPDKNLYERIRTANTTDDALSILEEACPSDAGRLTGALLDETAEAVKQQLDDWADGRLRSEVIVFSREGAIGASGGVKDHLSL